MEVKLIVVDGKSNRRQVKLKLPADIGRSRQAKLTIGHARVSRQHCQLVERNGFVVVKDLGSLNGTFVDGDRVTEAVIKPGERLTVGPLTFQVEYEAPVEAAEVAGDDGDLDAFLGQEPVVQTAEAVFDRPTEETPALATGKPGQRGAAEPDFDFLADEGDSQESELQEVPSFDDEEAAPAAEADAFEFESPGASAAGDDDTWNSAAPPAPKVDAEDDEPFDFDDQAAAEEPAAEEAVGGSLWERALSGIEDEPEPAASQDEDVFPAEDVVPVDEDDFAADEPAGNSEGPAFEPAPEPASRPRAGGRGSAGAVDFSFLTDDAADDAAAEAEDATSDEPAASDEQDFFPGEAAAHSDAAPAADSDFEQALQDVAVEDGPADAFAGADEDASEEEAAEEVAAEDFFAAEDAEEQPAAAQADEENPFDFLDDEADEVAPAAEATASLEPEAADDAFEDALDEALSDSAAEQPSEAEAEVAAAQAQETDETPDFGFLMDDVEATAAAIEQPAEEAVAEEITVSDVAAETPADELPEVDQQAAETSAAETSAAVEPVAEAPATESPAAEATAAPAVKKGAPLKGQPLKGRPFKRPVAASAPPVAEEPAAVEPPQPVAEAEELPQVVPAPAAETPAVEEPVLADEGGLGDESDDVSWFDADAELSSEEPAAEEVAALDDVVEESLADELPSDETPAEEVGAEDVTAEEAPAEEAPAPAAEFTGFDAAPSTSSAAARKPAKKEKRGSWLLNLFGKKDKAKGKASKDEHSATSNGRAPAPVFETPSEPAESEAILPEDSVPEEPSFEAEDDFAFEAIDEAAATNGVYHDEPESAADEAFDDEEVEAFDFEEAAEEEPAPTAEAAAEETSAASEQESPKQEAAAKASDDDSPDDALSQFLKGFN